MALQAIPGALPTGTRHARMDPEEIAELGPNVRSSVRAGLRLKKAVLERIAILGKAYSEPTVAEFDEASYLQAS